jgi:hypothetical protein
MLGKARRFTNLELLPRVGIGRKLIAMNSLIEKQCLHGLGCHPFCDLSGASGFPSIIGSRLGRYFAAPSPQKRLLPFHFGLPCGSAVVSGSGRSRRHYHSALQPYIRILAGKFRPFRGEGSEGAGGDHEPEGALGSGLRSRHDDFMGEGVWPLPQRHREILAPCPPHQWNGGGRAPHWGPNGRPFGWAPYGWQGVPTYWV